MEKVDTPTKRIREAQLLVATPERVFDELKAYREQLNRHGIVESSFVAALYASARTDKGTLILGNPTPP